MVLNSLSNVRLVVLLFLWLTSLTTVEGGLDW